MITMNMTTKREVRITDKHFSLENDILTLNINLYDNLMSCKYLENIVNYEDLIGSLFYVNLGGDL